ncbi:MAG: fimbrillin family protein [Alistipes sp.]|nr:fimbrillin family protein [Alistipes sp.]
MKKLFVAVLAIAGLVACNNEETVLVKGNAPIAFDSFVENATRANDPSTTTASLDAFDVWAYMDELAGTVFVGEDVTKRNGEWSYQNTQYWVPGHDYYFTAIAPMNSENWSYNQVEKTIEFTNVDGSEDLLFESVVAEDVTSEQSAVNLAFEHLLSKVKFTFVNGFLTDNAFVKVEAVKMVAPNTGVYDIASESWTVAGSETYSFGDVAKLGMAEKAAAAEERLTIPAAADYTVTFKATLYMGEVEAMSQEFEVAVKNVLLEKGKAYNFVAEVNPDSFKLKAIEFDVVTVNEWVTAENDANVEEAELLAAAQLGGEVVLTRDLVLSKPVAVKGNLVVDLNGKTISIDREGVETQDYVFLVYEGGKLTINGEGNVNAGEANTSVAVWAYGGDVVLNGGYYTNAGEGCDLIYADKGSVVTIYGGTFKACEKQPGVAGTQERYSALNLKDNTSSSIVVYGGSFYQFNPANNTSEGANTNFVAGGYKAVANGDWFDVVVNAAESVAADATAELTDDAVVASKFFVEGTLNGNGKTLYTAATPVDNGMIRPKGTATVNNLTIDGGNKSYFDAAGEEYTLRAIYINDGGEYNFDHITTKGTGYAINVNTKQPVELTVKNSNLEGWTSYGASTTATFENVTFSKGIYNTFRPYGNTVLTNCEFNDMVIDLQLLAEGKSVRFENCGITRDDLSGVKGHWYVCEEEDDVITVYATAQVTLEADSTETLTINKHTVLNLNGKNINTNSDAIVVENGATLIINGNGNVKASVNGDSSANALWVKHGNVVINGGSYFVGADNEDRNDCIYIGSAAQKDNAANLVSKVIINGGSFESAKFEAGQYWVLNLRDEFYRAGSTFVVRGGSYKNFDPSNNVSENPATNFVDAGYTVVKNDNWYIVK